MFAKGKMKDAKDIIIAYLAELKSKFDNISEKPINKTTNIDDMAITVQKAVEIRSCRSCSSLEE